MRPLQGPAAGRHATHRKAVVGSICRGALAYLEGWIAGSCVLFPGDEALRTAAPYRPSGQQGESGPVASEYSVHLTRSGSQAAQAAGGRTRIDLPHAASIRPPMREIELLVETYLSAERDLATAVDAAGGSVLLPDGRTVTTVPRA
jgi:hypothetical protein